MHLKANGFVLSVSKVEGIKKKQPLLELQLKCNYQQFNLIEMFNPAKFITFISITYFVN